MTKTPKAFQRVDLSTVGDTVNTIGILSPCGRYILKTVDNVYMKAGGALNNSNISMIRVRRLRRLRQPYGPVDLACNSIVNSPDIVTKILGAFSEDSVVMFWSNSKGVKHKVPALLTTLFDLFTHAPFVLGQASGAAVRFHLLHDGSHP